MLKNSCEILDNNILLTPLTDDPAKHDDGADDASSKVLYSRTRARQNQPSTHVTRHDFSEFIADTFYFSSQTWSSGTGAPPPPSMSRSSEHDDRDERDYERRRRRERSRERGRGRSRSRSRSRERSRKRRESMNWRERADEDNR